MLDPGLEHQHRHGRLWRASKARKRLMMEARVDAALLVPILLLFIFAPAGHWASAQVVIPLIAAITISSTVRFEVGAGSTSPTQLLWVPLWFAVPAPWIPVIIAATFVMGGVLEHYREHKAESVWLALLNAGDAWPTLGPAVVFAVASPQVASLDAVWVVVAALAAQTVVDLIVGNFTLRHFHGMSAFAHMRVMLWVSVVDLALAPVGFIVAVVMATQPLAILAVLPLIGVIAEFARERHDRLEQAMQLSSAYRGTAQLMGDVLEADDAYTGGEHTQGVVDMAVAIGLELRLSPRDMRDLEFGALLHDIGKLRVPNEVINKPGSLNAAEWDLIRKHPEYGQAMLDRVGGAMTDAGKIVRAHHERWDGLGYPDRLAAAEIPLPARIITVCDSFSAMTTTRSYSPAMTDEEGLAELRRCSGTQFDPDVVDALILVIEREPSLRSAIDRVARPASASPIAAALGLRPLL